MQDFTYLSKAKHKSFRQGHVPLFWVATFIMQQPLVLSNF